MARPRPLHVVFALLGSLIGMPVALAMPGDPPGTPVPRGDAAGMAIGQVLSIPVIERNLGLYMHFGGGWVRDGAGPAFAIGALHHWPVGFEFEVALNPPGATRLTGALRFVPWRMGLDAPWGTPKAPERALFVSLRAGLTSEDWLPMVAPLVGVDVELMLWRRLMFGLKLAVAIDPSSPLAGSSPSALLVVGIAPAAAYGER